MVCRTPTLSGDASKEGYRLKNVGRIDREFVGVEFWSGELGGVAAAEAKGPRGLVVPAEAGGEGARDAGEDRPRGRELAECLGKWPNMKTFCQRVLLAKCYHF